MTQQFYNCYIQTFKIIKNVKKLIFSLLAIGLATASFAQKKKDQVDSYPVKSSDIPLSFRNVGPAGMSGRVTGIDVNLKNDQEIYIGTASGGLWRSRSGGQ